MLQYKALYHFHCDDLDVIEIKRSGMPADAGPSDIYHWLVIENGSNSCIKLQFAGMTEKTRTFENGALVFDERFGKLDFKSRNFNLIRFNPELISKELNEKILGFIASINS